VNVIERTIFEQFEFWNAGTQLATRARPAVDYVVVGCGSSYNLAMSIAAHCNERGFTAHLTGPRLRSRRCAARRWPSFVR
jgi:glutamine---fructose-6-phosphate transaminase (isomerizing)